MDWFWNEELWLPPGYNWTDLRNPNPRGINYPESTDLLWYPIPFAFVLLIIRYLFEKTIAVPFGKWLGISERKKFKFLHNPILEKVYKVNCRTKFKLSAKELEKLSTQTGLQVRQVERWFRKRAILQKPSTLKKFSETSWRLAIYLTTTIVGAYTIWNKDWFWDIKECWRDYPHQNVTQDIWIHYILASSLYWSLMISQFFDTARKDFNEMFLHHVITLGLISFSWTTNFHRIGSLILIMHDVGDVILEAAKMSNYAGKKTLNTILNAVFTVVWMVTRIYIFPAHILRTINTDAPNMLTLFPIYHFMNVMLTLLFGIQVFWTYFLLKMVVRALSSRGSVLKDARSSSEGSISCSSPENSPNKKKL